MHRTNLQSVFYHVVAYEGQRTLNGKGVYLRIACSLKKEFKQVLLYTDASTLCREQTKTCSDL